MFKTQGKREREKEKAGESAREIEIQLILCPGHNLDVTVTLVFPRNVAVNHSGSSLPLGAKLCEPKPKVIR